MRNVKQNGGSGYERNIGTALRYWYTHDLEARCADFCNIQTANFCAEELDGVSKPKEAADLYNEVFHPSFFLFYIYFPSSTASVLASKKARSTMISSGSLIHLLQQLSTRRNLSNLPRAWAMSHSFQAR